MSQTQFNIGLAKFKSAFDQSEVNELGLRLGFAQKLRKITPFRLATTLISIFSERKVETIADIHRSFNEISGQEAEYKPFHNQIAKPSFPIFMRNIVSELLSKLSLKCLDISAESPFAMFRQILIQDASAFGIKSSLRPHFPGKFKVQAPAAVQLNTTMSLLDDEATTITLSPFKDAEVDFLPEPDSLNLSLLLLDRCYLDFDYMLQVNRAGGGIIVRAKRHLNPVVISAITGDGKRLNKLAGKKLKEIKMPKYKPLDLEVECKTQGSKETLTYRLIINWNEEKKHYVFLATNLSRDMFGINDILSAYRLRWQIELLFKEWKSYANLSKFDTSNPYIAEGLIWSALAAAIVKRFLAHVAQRVTQKAISTRIVAMCVGRKLSRIFEMLMKTDRVRLRGQLARLIDYLGKNAKRTNPDRERDKGRKKLGFCEFFGPLKN